VDGVKAFFTRQIGPLPVYAYAIGLLALVGGVWYFKTHNTGSATVAPQTNYPTGSNVPLPYPDPGSGAAGIPPSAAFDMSGGTSVPQYTSQSNFNPTPAGTTSSTDFSNAVNGATLYNNAPGSAQSQTPIPTAPSIDQRAALTNIPFLGPILARVLPPSVAVPTTAARGRFA
jgi:hypothetical protein